MIEEHGRTIQEKYCGSGLNQRDGCAYYMKKKQFLKNHKYDINDISSSSTGGIRTILGINQSDYITGVEFLEQADANSNSTEAILRQTQL